MRMLKNNWPFCSFLFNFSSRSFVGFGSSSTTGFSFFCTQLIIVSPINLSYFSTTTVPICEQKSSKSGDAMCRRETNLCDRSEKSTTNLLHYKKISSIMKDKPLVVQQRRGFLKYLKALKSLKREILEESKKKLLPRQRRRYNSLPFSLRTPIPLPLKVSRIFNDRNTRKIHPSIPVIENPLNKLPVTEALPAVSAYSNSSEVVPEVPLLVIPGSSLYVSKNSTSRDSDSNSKVSALLFDPKARKRRSPKKRTIDDFSVDYEEKSFDSYRGTTFLTLRPTRNNFFLTLWESRKGRMLINVSSGCVGFSGPDRVSEYAIKLLTLHFLRLARIKKIRHFRVIVPDGAKSSSNVKRCLGILGEPSSGVQVNFVLHISSRAHNGCRGKKQRRV